MKSKKVVVTGGCGFIGSNLTAELAKENHVTVLDNLSYGRADNLAGLSKKNVRFVKGDITDYKLLEKVLKNKDYVFHQAAMASVAESWEKPKEANEVNVTGTQNVLRAAVKNRVKKVIFASSSSVYGVPKKVPIPENSEKTPLSPYGAAKLIGEHYCRIYMEAYGLPTVSLRYFNVYGPKQNPDSPYAAVIPRFIRCGSESKPFEIYGDGEQTRDFIYVKDLVSVAILAAECKKCEGEALNVGSGEKTSIKQLGEKISELLGREFKARYLPPRLGDIKSSLADVSKMKSLLGFKPAFSLERGLSETIKYLGGSE